MTRRIGITWHSFSRAGHDAVKACSPETQVMLHIAEGGDNELARWWFDSITRRDVPFDVIGISYYPYWHGSLGELQYNLNDISARYDKDVIVVETAYAFTDQDNDGFPNIANQTLVVPHYPYSPEGQRDLLRNVMSIVRGCGQWTRPRRVLLGRYLDGGGGQWLGQYQPRRGERLGKSGFV